MTLQRGWGVALRSGALAALWASVGVAGLALLLAARGADPEALYRELLATIAVATLATGVLTGGTYSPRELSRVLRHRDLATGVGLTGGALIAVALAGPVARSAGAGAGPGLLLATAAVVGGAVAVHAVWTRPTDAETPVRPWVAASAVTATFVTTSLATMAVGLPDVYPLSSYPMFSAERGPDHRVDQVRFVGITADGEEEGLGRPVSREALLQLAVDGDIDGLERLLRDQVGSDHPYAALEVRRETIRIAPHPEPVEARTIDQEVLWRSDGA